ncbi:DUF2167 domain-containing protein [Lutibacter maritimus]|uniref:Uncharacterized membrane-anchored protein n=1 Tax=Lutibacter maritimus TaxID=593133 RepID=A0A1I6NVD6_9FLAO|nr:DUF2167 domain-containing protein [Lutibacter maritimus]SFS31966.1 Uncharacterized membrane-anchored protein [Lutibacter maritimus]
MKKITFTIITLLFVSFAFSQEEEDYQQKIDSIEKSFNYEYGTISLKNNIGKIIIPNGFKYLNIEQSERVLTDLWGNPKYTDMTLGLILPENQGIMDDNGYVFNIQYDEIGYVEDDDANKIDYDELLTQIQDDSKEENKERIKEGYEPINIIGWASKPYYDKSKKILHWAKEIKFGDQEINTLNYNIRILGRKGVLVLNAIATIPDLTYVQNDIPKVLDIVQFSEGNKYADFDSSIDDVAAWTIGGLVAGKVLTKVGFFALILKFWKIILIAVAAFFKPLMNLFRKKNHEITSSNQKELSE